MEPSPGKPDSPYQIPFHTLDDQDFEEFCLAFLHQQPHLKRPAPDPQTRVISQQIIEADRLLGGTDQRGADLIAKTDHGEIWTFQCKNVQEFHPKDVSEAMQQLDDGFPHAKAKVLITRCRLSAKSLEPISARHDWSHWDGARLTSLVQQIRPIEDALRLVHRFFPPEVGRDLFPWDRSLLLTWREFHRDDLNPNQRRHFHHQTPYLPPPGTVEHLMTFATQGAGRALIVSAGGGQGKSRLALEFARIVESRPAAPRVLFLNLRRPDALTDDDRRLIHLRGKETLVLVIDDAHRLDGALAELATATQDCAELRLLLLTRPQAVTIIRSLLVRHGWKDRVEAHYPLPEWSSQDLRSLATKALGKQLGNQAERLATLSDHCPLLVVLGASLAAAGSPLDTLSTSVAFRERVLESFIDDHLQRIPEADHRPVRRLIEALAFVSPIPEHTAIECLSDIIELTRLDAGEHLAELRAAGLVVDHHAGVRLYPDLFADAVLRKACLDPAGQVSPLARNVLAKLDPAECPALFRNVAQADWEIGILNPRGTSVFEPLWQAIRNRFQSGDHQERQRVLALWAPLAAFQPARTLSLAEEALRDLGPEYTPHITPLIESVAQWHPDCVAPALDLLWKAETTTEPVDDHGDTHPITTLARIASYQVGKPPAIHQRVLDWIRNLATSRAGRDRLATHRWILAAMLRPFFGTRVERWTQEGSQLQLSIRGVRLEVTRHLRQQALAIVETLALGEDRIPAPVWIPILRQALQPLDAASTPFDTDDLREWDEERMRALDLVERLLGAPGPSNRPLHAFQLDALLASITRRKPGTRIQARVNVLRSGIPRDLAFQLYEALTEWANPRPPAQPSGTPGKGSQRDRTREPQEPTRQPIAQTAKDAAKTWPTHEALCNRIEAAILDLQDLGYPTDPAELLSEIASSSPASCSDLLSHLITRPGSALDAALPHVLPQAAQLAPEAYHRVLRSTKTLSPARIVALVDFLGWKFRHGGGLTPEERTLVVQITGHPDAVVSHRLAQAVWLWLSTDTELSLDLLDRLEPRNPTEAEAFLQGLAATLENATAPVDPSRVAECLRRVPPQHLDSSTQTHDALTTIAQFHPKATYDYYLHSTLPKEAPVRQAQRPTWRTGAIPPLGPMPDPSFLHTELRDRWQSASRERPGCAARRQHLELAQALAASDSKAAMPVLRNLMDACHSGTELHAVAEIVAVRGTRFTFDHPEIVALLLRRATELQMREEITQVLRDSALGGSRSWTNTQLDPQHLYILDESRSLARKYHGNPLLGDFYASLAHHEESLLDQVRPGHSEDVESQD